MLAHNVPFEENLIDLNSWQNGEKKRIQEEVNPAGHLPVLTVDGKNRAECVATMRYVATKVRLRVHMPNQADGSSQLVLRRCRVHVHTRV